METAKNGQTHTWWDKIVPMFLRSFLAVTIYLALAKNAHAYLDPGTGSYVVQILIATLAGGAYVFAMSWSKIKTFLSKLASKISQSKNGKGK
jgi:hypothetical protein